MFCTIQATVDSFDEAIPSVRVSIEAEEWEFDEAVAKARQAVKDFYKEETPAATEAIAATGDQDGDIYDPEKCAGCPAEAECAAEARLLQQQQTPDLGAVYGKTPVLLFNADEPDAEPLLVYIVDPLEGGQA